jgi:hypothetical protein
MWWLHYVMCMLVIVKDFREFFRDKNKRNKDNHMQNPSENLIQSAFQQTLGDKFTFQQDNNLKDKAKCTLELLTETTLNFSEWPSYSVD